MKKKVINKKNGSFKGKTLEVRFGALEVRFDRAMKSIDQRFEAIDQRFEALDKRLESMELSTHERFETMLTYVDGRFDDIESKMVTQDQWSKHMELMDRIMEEIEQSRQQRLFSGEQGVRMEETVQDHEKRIRKLEKANV